MAGTLREVLSRANDARSLLRDLFTRTADILPDEVSGTIGVRVHASSNPRHDRAITHLLEQLTAAEQTYPGTKLKLTYTVAGVAQTRIRDQRFFPEIKKSELQDLVCLSIGEFESRGRRVCTP